MVPNWPWMNANTNLGIVGGIVQRFRNEIQHLEMLWQLVCVFYKIIIIYYFSNFLGSRESAYLSAVSAASVAFAVTRACSKGELSDCSCDNKIRQKKSQKWKWGGCSEDIKYGERFSKDFLDAKEDANTASGLMNLHNNEAGRRVRLLFLSI